MLIFNQEPVIVKLIPDPAIGIVKESRQAGLVKLQIKISKESERKVVKYVADDDDEDSKSKKNMPVSNLQNYYVVANIYQVKN